MTTESNRTRVKLIQRKPLTKLQAFLLFSGHTAESLAELAELKAQTIYMATGSSPRIGWGAAMKIADVSDGFLTPKDIKDFERYTWTVKAEMVEAETDDAADDDEKAA